MVSFNLIFIKFPSKTLIKGGFLDTFTPAKWE